MQSEEYVIERKRIKSAYVKFFRKNFVKYLIVIIFLLMVLTFSVLSSNFLSLLNLKSILIQTSMLSIISFGMTMVMMNGGVDLSIGSVAGLSTIFGVTMMVYHNVSVFTGILMGMGVGASIGLLNGILVAGFSVAPFVATLSTMFIAQGLQFSINHGESIGFGFPSGYINMGSSTFSFLGIPMPIFIFLAVMIIMVFLSEKTTYGRFVRAIGLNQYTSKYSGVRVRLLTMSVYIFSGVLAALSGLILGASQSYIQPNLGDSFLLDSLVVVLLGKASFGGYISILGTVFGVIFLKSLETGLAMLGTPIMVMNITKGSLLLAVLLISIYQKKLTLKKG